MGYTNFFADLEKKAADYQTTRAAVKESNNEARQVTQAIKERWEAEESRRKARMDELSEAISDTDKPAAVRKLAQAELEELGRYKRTVLQAEAEAFSEALDDAEEALAELREMYAELKALFDKVSTVCQSMKKDTVSNQISIQLMRTWLEGTEKEYRQIGGYIVEAEA